VNPLTGSRRELDSVVVNIELTLASIIQGVALFFLTDNARAILSWRHWDAFLYVAAGLCVIFIFWSRSIIHTLTLIKWPLEFGHHLFYSGCVLGEAILFSRLDRPLAWFQLSAAYAGVVWLLFIYDMRLIRARVAESSNDAEQALYARARADQLLNIWLLVPLLQSRLRRRHLDPAGFVPCSPRPRLVNQRPVNLVHCLSRLHRSLLQNNRDPGLAESPGRLTSILCAPSDSELPVVVVHDDKTANIYSQFFCKPRLYHHVEILAVNLANTSSKRPKFVTACCQRNLESQPAVN